MTALITCKPDPENIWPIGTLLFYSGTETYGKLMRGVIINVDTVDFGTSYLLKLENGQIIDTGNLRLAF